MKHPLPDNHVFVLNFNGFSYEEENQTFQLEPYGFVWLGVL